MLFLPKGVLSRTYNEILKTDAFDKDTQINLIAKLQVIPSGLK